MSSHTRVCAHRPLEVHAAAFLQAAQVGAPQRLRRDADFELILGELGDGQAGAVDADAVAKVGVDEDLGTAGDGQAGAAASARGFVVLGEARDGWAAVSAQLEVGMVGAVGGGRTAYGLNNACEHDGGGRRFLFLDFFL